MISNKLIEEDNVVIYLDNAATTKKLNNDLICALAWFNNCSACKPAWCGLLGLKYSDWFTFKNVSKTF